MSPDIAKRPYGKKLPPNDTYLSKEVGDSALEVGVAQELRTDLKMEKMNKLHGSQSCVISPAVKEGKNEGASGAAIKVCKKSNCSHRVPCHVCEQGTGGN